MKIRICCLQVFFLLIFVVLGLGKTVEDIEKEAKAIEDNHGKIDFLNESVKDFQKTSLENTLVLANQALQLSENTNYQKGRAAALQNIGIGYYFASDYKKAILYLNESLDIFEKENYSEGVILSLNKLGNTYWYIGDYDKALRYQTRALAIAKFNDNKKSIADIYRSIGVIYSKKNDLAKTLENYLASLRIYEELDSKEDMALIYNNIASLYLKFGEEENSFEYYQKALDISKELNDVRRMVIYLNNIGNAYERKGEYEKTFATFSEALEKAQEINYLNGIAYTYGNIGRFYVKKKEFAKALNNFEKSINISKKIDDKYSIVVTTNYIGNAYSVQGEYDKALKYYLDNLKLIKEVKMMEMEIDSYNDISGIYEKKGDYKNALESYKQYVVLKDSMMSKEKEKTIEELQIKYDSDKKESEIEILTQNKQLHDLQLEKTKDLLRYLTIILVLILILAIVFYNLYRVKHRSNKLLEKQNIDIEEQNRILSNLNHELHDINSTKDKFISIIAHDLRNPLTAMIGRSELLMLKFERLASDELKRNIQEIHKASNRMLVLLENLLEWARSQMGKLHFEPENLNLAEIVSEIMNLFRTACINKRIVLVSSIEDKEEIFADRNMLKAVLRNLVSNAIKFTDEKGKIEIHSSYRKDKISISITDTGIGIEKDNIAKLFNLQDKYTTSGTAKEKGSGLGLLICKEFVEKNNGTISVVSEKGIGSTFTITFPIRNK